MFQNGKHCFPIRHHKCHVFLNGIYSGAEKKILILNLKNIFSTYFKKILSGQKLDNLFIFKLSKFSEDWSKTVIHFFLFSEGTTKMIKWCPIGYQVTNYRNIYHAKYKGHQRLLMPNWASFLYWLLFMCSYLKRYQSYGAGRKSWSADGQMEDRLTYWRTLNISDCII